MAFRRVPAPTAPSTTPRSSLDPSVHTAVDGVLKDIKIFSRRLCAAMNRQEEELQVLERLYYKGKNQHRAALFWKRVAEIRRYGRRLEGVGIPDIVERLRCSFFGDGVQQSTKSLKGSWTHFPDIRYVAFVLERLSACRVLVEKMQDRLLAAYRLFTLAMQSVAFIQLVLTLTAIASRMHFFVTDIRDILVSGLTVCQRTLQVVDPTNDGSAEGNGTMVSAATRTGSAKKSDLVIGAVLDPDVTIHEDIGLSVARKAPCTPDTQVQGPSGVVGRRLPETQAPINDDNTVLDGLVILQQIEGALFTSENAPSMVENIAILHGSKSKRRSRQDNPDAKRKKKKKRDEIDDIFGD